MGLLDLFTGDASNRAYRNNNNAIATGLNQGMATLDGNYGLARDQYGAALPVLGTAYGNAGSAIAGAYGNSRTDLNAGFSSGRDFLSDNAGSALSALGRGYGNATSAVSQGYADADSMFGQGRDDLISGYGQGRTDLGNQYGETQNYLGQATAAYDPMIAGSYGAFTGYMDAAGANGAAGSERAQQNFRAAPGYQYQMDQALDAVQRSAAARGGLAGGNLTADILRTATGLADQSYQQSVDNLYRGAGFYGQGIAGRAAGLTNQAGASERYGNALAGLDTRLADQLSANSGQRAGLAAQRGSALGNLYSAQGNAEAGVYGNLGSALNANSMGLGSGLSALDTGYGNSLSNNSIGYGSNVANIFGNIASNYSNLGNAQAGLISNATNSMVQNNNNRAQADNAAGANILNGILGAIGLATGQGGSLAGRGSSRGGL